MTVQGSRLALALIALALSACAVTPSRAVDGKTIDAEVRRLMQREHVNGLAIAVIEDGAVTVVNAYGIRKSNPDAPLTTDTIMYGASLTKTVFAYLVMQLVDQHRLDLDASIATLLPKRAGS